MEIKPSDQKLLCVIDSLYYRGNHSNQLIVELVCFFEDLKIMDYFKIQSLLGMQAYGDLPCADYAFPLLYVEPMCPKTPNNSIFNS